MEITNALASNFIEADLIERESAAAGTNTFLEGELENVRKRLIEKEDELKAYRQQFMGQLPEQLGTNLSMLQGLQSQLTAKEANLRELKSRLSEAQDLVPVGAADPNDIGSLRRQLAELMMRYTENHPDVTRLKNRIKELENGAGADGSAGQAAAGGGISQTEHAAARAGGSRKSNWQHPIPDQDLSGEGRGNPQTRTGTRFTQARL